MPTASPPPVPPSTAAERRRGAIRALLAALASAPPHPAFCVWFAPCGPWLSSVIRRES